MTNCRSDKADLIDAQIKELRPSAGVLFAIVESTRGPVAHDRLNLADRLELGAEELDRNRMA